MRLVENAEIQDCSLDEMLILVRHGVDVPILSQDLNQPLTQETKPDIRTLSKQIIRFCGQIGSTRILIRHSARLRAIQTAAIIAEELFAINMPIRLVESPGVREVYQGEFIIDRHVNGTEYKPLVYAWNAWQKKLDDCELLYRFGDPIKHNSGEAEFPELVGWFTKLGEHQGDFSLRLYQMIKDVLETQANLMQIIIGHQASCSRVQRILSAASRLESPDDFEPGEFVRFLEKKGSRITINHACGIILRKPKKDLLIPILEKEIKYLKDIV